MQQNVGKMLDRRVLSRRQPWSVQRRELLCKSESQCRASSMNKAWAGLVNEVLVLAWFGICCHQKPVWGCWFLMKILVTSFILPVDSSVFRRTEFSHKCVADSVCPQFRADPIPVNGFIPQRNRRLLNMVWLTCVLWAYPEHSEQKISTFLTLLYE